MRYTQTEKEKNGNCKALCVTHKRNIQFSLNAVEMDFAAALLTFGYLHHRNIKTKGIAKAKTSIIKLDGFYWFCESPNT